MVRASAPAPFAEEARRRPMVVLVDRFHGADSSNATALLALLHQRIAGLRTAMACTPPVDGSADRPRGGAGVVRA
ncbi:hypothetical protein ACGFZK_21405 [Streptomyces sp. NPDC048257]|uniref:hypothetical protein n=1 Tax=Streptomyces sp. NPDC048257 TaxID=3365526 RepID=UPI0037206983